MLIAGCSIVIDSVVLLLFRSCFFFLLFFLWDALENKMLHLKRDLS